MGQVSHPKESKQYGSYKWHSAWEIDVAKREARHKSGVVYDFSSGVQGSKQPPLGGRCPSLAWQGELRGGALSLSVGLSDDVAVRLCLEACVLFSDLAWDACQDCSKHTAGNDYYMVQHDLWAHMHPNRAGMLCLSCLQTRMGRILTRSDFIDAPVNYLNPAVAVFFTETPTTAECASP